MSKIQFPVSLEKTFGAATQLVFLGLLIDSIRQVVCIPHEKVDRARNLVSFFIDDKNKKATVKQIQKLTGFLNFLCRCVVPGRAFTRRLYTYVNSKMKPHHHIRITAEMRRDLQMWWKFLTHPDVYCRSFIDFTNFSAIDVDLFSDASKSLKCGGLGAVCGNQWMIQPWNYKFLKEQEPSIEYLELFAVTAAVLSWLHKFRNMHIHLFCDNMSVVHMINNSSSTCKNCMVLIRKITLAGLFHNTRYLQSTYQQN